MTLLEEQRTYDSHSTQTDAYGIFGNFVREVVKHTMRQVRCSNVLPSVWA